VITLLADHRFGAGKHGNNLLGKGWAVPESRFVWSMGRQSTLTLPNPPGSKKLALELTLDPFRVLPALRYQRVRISVNGTVIGERRLGGPIEWWLPVPDREAGKLLHFVLDCPDAAVPREVGAGRDARMLGVKLSRATLFSDSGAIAPAPLHLVREAHFGWNETTEHWLASGWAEPENRYAWAVGRSSTLRVPVDADGGDIVAVLDIRPYLEPPALPRQRFVVGADGRLVTYLDLACHTAVALRLTPVSGQTSVMLQFDHVDAHLGDPARRHGHGLAFAFMLFSARIVPAPEKAAPRSLPPLTGRISDGSLQAQVRALTGLTIEDLIARFESLGNGCALGLLQQQMGVARPGLLQFSEWWQPRLVDALMQDFRGFGRPDKLEWLERHSVDPGWLVRDQIYAISIPTPYDKSAPVPPHAPALESRRLPRLATKLLEDAANAEKIFVFRSPDPLIAEAAEAVRAALAHRGDVTVLWLTDGAPGSLGGVQQIDHGLLRGYHPPGDAPIESLVSVLANAWVLAQQQRAKNTEALPLALS
jgi:hypothetical protein